MLFGALTTFVSSDNLHVLFRWQSKWKYTFLNSLEEHKHAAFRALTAAARESEKNNSESLPLPTNRTYLKVIYHNLPLMLLSYGGWQRTLLFLVPQVMLFPFPSCLLVMPTGLMDILSCYITGFVFLLLAPRSPPWFWFQISLVSLSKITWQLYFCF